MNKPALSLTVVMLLAIAAPLVGLRAQPAPAALDAVAAPARPDWARLPLAFEPNAGQSDPHARYLAHTPAGLLFFAPDEVLLALQAPVPGDASASAHLAAPREAAAEAPATARVGPAGPTLRLAFIDASPASMLVGDEQLPGRVNYFIGDDPSRWHVGLPTYARVTYAQLYPGIDLAYRGSGGHLKGTYTVAPGADPAQIRWRYDGARAVTLDASGDLQIELSAADGSNTWRVTEPAPVAWQETGAQRVAVPARYVVDADGSIGFALGAYDRALPLVLDPTLVYSTYLGGSDYDRVQGIAVDAAGSAYVAGLTRSTNFPLQAPFQGIYGGSLWDAFVTKFSPSGTGLVYSTYLGGSADDSAHGIALDAAGNAYVTGDTGSTNFPLQDPLQGTSGGDDDVFVTKFSPSGTALVYSTYLGGSGYDLADGIAVDPAGNAYVTGHTVSTNFPLQVPFQGTSGGGDGDAFVTKFSPSGAALVYSTYLGGSGGDWIDGIAVDAAGSAYVTGATGSTNFPLQDPFQGTYGGGPRDTFVTKFSPSGTALVYSTYLGSSGLDLAHGIAVDAAGSAYVTGDTNSTDFPLQNPFQGTSGGYSDAFVTKFSPSGTALVYSTYLGGSYPDYAYGGIAVDAVGSAYVTGYTVSTNFPLQDPFQGALNGYQDAFVTKFSPSGTALAYSTLLGGSDADEGSAIAVDAAGNAYVTGKTLSTDFPLQDPFQGTYGGGFEDSFVTKLGPRYRVTLPVVLHNH